MNKQETFVVVKVTDGVAHLKPSVVWYKKWFKKNRQKTYLADPCATTFKVGDKITLINDVEIDPAINGGNPND